ncbi:MAG: efflux system transcriptional repressor MexL [Parvularculaceae bacterium]
MTPIPAFGQENEKGRAIFDAAMALFLEEGYDGASMDRIAARAGVSKRTVYNRFKSKEDLFGAVVGDMCCQILPMGAPETGFDEPPREFLTRFALNFLRFSMEPQMLALHRLLSFEAARSPQLGALFFENGPSKVLSMLSDYFERQTALGRLETPDFEKAAWQFMALIKEPLHFRALFGQRPENLTEAIEAQADAGVAAFIKLYGASSGQSGGQSE